MLGVLGVTGVFGVIGVTGVSGVTGVLGVIGVSGVTGIVGTYVFFNVTIPLLTGCGPTVVDLYQWVPFLRRLNN